MERRQAMIFSYITMDRHHCQGLLSMSTIVLVLVHAWYILNVCFLPYFMFINQHINKFLFKFKTFDFSMESFEASIRVCVCGYNDERRTQLLMVSLNLIQWLIATLSCH